MSNYFHLADDVLVGVLQPLAEGDEAVAFRVHRLEVLATLGNARLQKIGLVNGLQ